MSGLVVKAKTEAMKLRHDEPIFVRVYEQDGVAMWSKIDGNMHDLTELNSDGLLYHVRSVFVPHGSGNPLKNFTQEAADTIEALHSAMCNAINDLEEQQSEPLSGSDADRLHYWRDKALLAADNLRTTLVKVTVS